MRLIDQDGKQVGIVPFMDALKDAENAGLDLVEMVATSNPPVCKIMDFGKYRYDQTKREKESKKSQHVIKVKEVKLKPNIDPHDFDTKLRHAKEFISKGNKVKISMMFRGREMAHPEIGERWVKKMCADMEDIAIVEAPAKLMGRSLSCVLAPAPKKSTKGKPVEAGPKENTSA